MVLLLFLQLNKYYVCFTSQTNFIESFAEQKKLLLYSDLDLVFTRSIQVKRRDKKVNNDNNEIKKEY